MDADIDIEILTTTITNLTAQYIPRLVLAIITLFVGFWITKRLVRLLDIALEKQNVDVSLASFLESLANMALKVIVIITVASMVGIQVTSLIAVLGAAGFAIGMALQGSLANFAGGVLILLFKPFKVGDWIEAQGHEGKVKEITIIYTILNTLDNKRVTIPNGDLSNGSVINYSAERKRQVEMIFGIGYNDDIKKARTVLSKIFEKDERILPNERKQILVGNLGDSAVEIKCRVWTKTSDYWPFYYDMQEQVKLAFDKAGISIPYPQRDVYMYQKN